MKMNNSNRTRRICYFTSLSMTPVFCLSPILFSTFRETYGISYTLLGTLIVMNFCTQLLIDLIFSFYSRHFNIPRTLALMPLVTALGLCLYALVPTFFPQKAYIGLALGTIVFSIAAGLNEVLLSPTVASLESETPDRDMSMLHSLYGYGLVARVLLSTLFLNLAGKEYWMYLVLFWASFPIIASYLLFRTELPQMDKQEDITRRNSKAEGRTKGIILCMFCIFLGAAAENTMSNWISTYTESALELSKMWADLFGMCLFSSLLALTRTAYGKFGRNISLVLVASMLGSACCYVLVAMTLNNIISLAGCILVGIFTSMLWPGTLILMEEKIPGAGVSAYALMAAGGDLGASIAPLLMGVVVDSISITPFAADIGKLLGLTVEQVGFKTGMLLTSLFPIAGLILVLYMRCYFKKKVI